ncbi:MAG TPA: AAA family ATPase [bacterium]|nr:AAA family ATPase [bacterium]
MQTVFDPMNLVEETTVGKRLFVGRAAPGPQQRLLMEHYDLTHIGAAVFMVVFAAQLEERQESLTDIAQRHNISGPRYRTLLNEYFMLVKKKLIVPTPYLKNASPLCCGVEASVMKGLMQGELGGEPFDPAEPFSIIQSFSELWQQLDDKELTARQFHNEGKELIKRMTPDNRLRELVAPYRFTEQVMIIVAAIDHINAQRSGVDLREFAKNFFAVLRDRAAFLRDISQGTVEVVKSGLIVLNDRGDDPFSRSPEFTLSLKMRSQLFGVQKTGRKEKLNIPGIFSHRSWRDKQPELYFDDRLAAELGTVARALSRSTGGRRLFSKRLRERGMPTGFTALFHGAPGTGKTASVHELARMVKRDILQVEMSAVRDKWVGESEKRTRAIFTEYRTVAGSLPACPILLLNEADALLTRRMDARTSVETMNNTMQNILLEELEKFEGILVATTNLTGMLDDAFSRRFLYKLEFPNPTPSIRARIWRSKLPELTGDEADTLAVHSLSGGEIENVARRYIVDSLFSGKPDLDRLEALCREESSLKKGIGRKVGF